MTLPFPRGPVRQSVCGSPGTDPAVLRQLRGLPARPAELTALVRNLIVHRGEYAGRGEPLPDDRRMEPETRYVADLLGLIRRRSDAPLHVPRAWRERFTGTCRDFALLLCSLLRHTGTHARVRCGFARYFTAGFHDDHWVTEYAHPGPGRGPALADAQVAEGYNVPFDPADLPREQFLTAGEAWRAYRSGGAAPETFGVSSLPEIRGAAFLRASVLRDLAALNGVEVLPWDTWGLGAVPEAEVTAGDLALLDAVAAAGSLGELRRLYADPRLRVPGEVLSHTTYGGLRRVSPVVRR